MSHNWTPNPYDSAGQGSNSSASAPYPNGRPSHSSTSANNNSSDSSGRTQHPPQPSSSTRPPNPPLTHDPHFDILEWHPAYLACQRYFLDHAQHEPATQALCALINIRLPFQHPTHPLTSSAPPQQQQPIFRATTTPAPQPAQSPYISLIPYIRRLVITAFDKPPILHGLFGDTYPSGILPHLDCERRNYLFAAKHGGWRSCKKQYDVGSMGVGGGGDESVPFMKPLDEATGEELGNAEKQWSRWLAMEDWMVGERGLPEEGGSGGGSQEQERDGRGYSAGDVGRGQDGGGAMGMGMGERGYHTH